MRAAPSAALRPARAASSCSTEATVSGCPGSSAESRASLYRNLRSCRSKAASLTRRCARTYGRHGCTQRRAHVAILASPLPHVESLAKKYCATSTRYQRLIMYVVFKSTFQLRSMWHNQLVSLGGVGMHAPGNRLRMGQQTGHAGNTCSWRG